MNLTLAIPEATAVEKARSWFLLQKTTLNAEIRMFIVDSAKKYDEYRSKKARKLKALLNENLVDFGPGYRFDRSRDGVREVNDAVL